MREILFRGKRLDNGEWAQGNYIKTHDGRAWIDETAFMGVISMPYVDPATVGQYTGLMDKNGKRIFENDILRWVGPDGESGMVFVRFAGGSFAFQSIECPLADPDLFSDFEDGCQTLEVIGNIHDNPELLEGGASE